MNKRLYLIANPMSGSGNGQEVLQEVQFTLNSLNIAHISFITEYAGHAVEIVKQICAKNSNPDSFDVFVIGGDGTLHEVVNTFIQCGIRPALTVIPAGTGNDFARTWQHGMSTREIIDSYLLYHSIQSIPIFSYTDVQQQKSDIVINNLGIGFDGTVIHYAKSLPKHSPLKRFANGKFSYIFCAFMSIFKLENFDTLLTINQQQEMLNDCQLVCVMNSPFFGGGVQLSQKIKPEDSTISILVFQQVGLKQLIKYLWQVIVKKQEPNSKYVKYFSGTHAEIMIEQAIYSQVDGELRQKNPNHLVFTVDEYPFYLPKEV
ncbi:YegS/Rv2252/BmrU family lipid kinase [Aerococcaceae bacterium zg-B36]|uniref:diacylglycerol/lipid kinase family protein n=1 Tax=Aerococcaceae bacterium zg-252 TaxID=2796928 RepID=UPI001BD8728B|nr:YegS/Rv2252/BmrU family lipid kinase [Aerococcaceae bacterium zg-B36]